MGIFFLLGFAAVFVFAGFANDLALDFGFGAVRAFLLACFAAFVSAFLAFFSARFASFAAFFSAFLAFFSAFSFALVFFPIAILLKNPENDPHGRSVLEQVAACVAKDITPIR
ncbi:MAG: hypothetical protein A2V78_02910 [Betaproteobacteria bacterium RBG_16_64_18]|nr:MAG: hypothetical protein A2V78_02910 [Betaproteobacteria bacterium RBG_16_64_18]